MGTLKDSFIAGESTQAPSPLSVLCKPPKVPSCAVLPTGMAAVGRLQGFDLAGQPLIGELPQYVDVLISARTTHPLTRALVGAEVLVLFEGGDALRPIVVGVLQPSAVDDALTCQRDVEVSVEADPQRQFITAQREIVLRCGDASITLTAAGKVIINGRYIVSRATGLHRIKGAAVDIN